MHGVLLFCSDRAKTYTSLSHIFTLRRGINVCCYSPCFATLNYCSYITDMYSNLVNIVYTNGLKSLKIDIKHCYSWKNCIIVIFICRCNSVVSNLVYDFIFRNKRTGFVSFKKSRKKKKTTKILIMVGKYFFSVVVYVVMQFILTNT